MKVSQWSECDRLVPTGDGGPLSDYRYKRDGQQLDGSSQRDVCVTERQLIKHPNRSPDFLYWKKDGTRIGICRNIYVYDF